MSGNFHENEAWLKARTEYLQKKRDCLVSVGFTCESFEDIEQQAQHELALEKFRNEVEAKKEELRRRKWWHKFVPKISIKWGI